MKRASIRLSARGRLIYDLLAISAFLLPVYAISVLLMALAQLPASSLTALLPPQTLADMSARLFQLVVCTGLTASGLRMARADFTVARGLWWRRAWITMIALVSVLTAAGQSAIADFALTLALICPLAATLRLPAPSIFLRAWQLSLLLIIVSLLAPRLFPAALLNAAFRSFVAYPIAAVSLYFWLMTRCGNVNADWVRAGLRIAIAALSLAGALSCLGRLGLPPLLSLVAAPIVPLAWMVVASHGYRALSSRNANASLAPHWLAFATLLFLAGGFIGALAIQPGYNAAAADTDLALAQSWLAEWALLAVILASVNDGGAALRGENLRVTGYAPLWLMAFGSAFAGIALLCRGVAQATLRDVAGLEPSGDRLLPLSLVFIVPLCAVAAGAVIYALGFWLRLPRIEVAEESWPRAGMKAETSTQA